MLPDIALFVYLLLFTPLALIVMGAVYQSIKMWPLRSWPSAQGVIVASGEELRKVKVLRRKTSRSRSFDESIFANIVYEYNVAGRTCTGNRVTVGEDGGNFEVAETIARYPAGKRVGVFSNPLDPADAVLERDLPKGLWARIGWMVVITEVVIFGAIAGFGNLTRLVAAHTANAPLAVALAAFGMLMALVALGIQRHAGQARR